MLSFKLSKISIPFCIVSMCILGLVCDQNIAKPLIVETSVSKMQKKSVSIPKVSLLAWTQIAPPNGVVAIPNGYIGFASVFFSVENNQENNQIITIQNIEIQSVADKKLQPFVFTSKQIELKPLENIVIDIHLTNKTGYVGQERVKAIVTYQIGDRLDRVESNTVDVERH